LFVVVAVVDVVVVVFVVAVVAALAFPSDMKAGASPLLASLVCSSPNAVFGLIFLIKFLLRRCQGYSPATEPSYSSSCPACFSPIACWWCCRRCCSCFSCCCWWWWWCVLYKSVAALRRSRWFEVVDRVLVLVALVVVVNTLPHFQRFFLDSIFFKEYLQSTSTYLERLFLAKSSSVL